MDKFIGCLARSCDYNSTIYFLDNEEEYLDKLGDFFLAKNIDALEYDIVLYAVNVNDNTSEEAVVACRLTNVSTKKYTDIAFDDTYLDVCEFFDDILGEFHI